ncbi:MAG: M23 family peptidase [Chloroflexi bacterium CFX7]|nr:MAG: M23 family metallopeptidase [bacterium]MCE7928292.1 M23 family peptidase [Chloroflexi bacterium CFX7]RIL01630.1 MAG: hypothetical protein DCC78_10335 [bacterium]
MGGNAGEKRGGRECDRRVTGVKQGKGGSNVPTNIDHVVLMKSIAHRFAVSPRHSALPPRLTAMSTLPAPWANLRGMRLRVVLAGLMLIAVPFAAACAGDSGAAPVVTYITPYAPPPTPTVAGPSPTPIPPPELLLSATSVYQAGAILASLTGEVSSGTVTFLGRKQQLAKGTQSLYTFLGVGVLDPSGPAEIHVEFTLKNGTKGTLTEPVTIVATDWTVDSLAFTDEQTANLLDPKVVEAENQLLAGVYATYTGEKLWDGPWLVPAPGAITARMGEQRSINGGPPSGHHGGTDIGNEEGTPVIAANSGRVVMVKELALHGNMVIIDHGGGLLTGYGHLSKFAVQEGQDVKGGDVIGAVGNTGLSTGAHLHWEVASYGVRLDALRFLDGSNGF